ncbi:MAG: DUF4338 domain-containing protein [Archaeoglobaceae archaeon]
MNEMERENLRKVILNYLKEIGFDINPHLRPRNPSKNFLRRIHDKRRIEQIIKNKNFLKEHTETVKKYYKPKEINLEDIKLKMVFIGNKNSEDYVIYKWWSIMWWSLPYERSVGRSIKYILFDEIHDLPFGIVGLQSPFLSCEARDKYLGISKEMRDYWVNQSLSAQRVGALPPYNQLFGGKIVAMSLSSRELWEYYKQKYNGKVTMKKKRQIPANLLFVTTLSAYGRSKMYEDLYFCGKKLSEFIGYSKGAGTFHFTDEIYEVLLGVLGKKICRDSFKTSPSRKLKLTSKALKLIGLTDFEYHNVKRAVYLFPHAENLREVISLGKKPKWTNFRFEDLYKSWKVNLENQRILPIDWNKIKLLVAKNLPEGLKKEFFSA